MTEIKLIKTIPVFEGLTSEELEQLASICKIHKTKTGQRLFKAGDARKSFYVILSGKLKISWKIKDEEETLAFMDKDNFAVESSLIDPKLKHTHFGEIIEEGEILEIEGKDFINLTKNYSRLANQVYGNIVKNITERLHHANNKLITLYSTGRIASTYANIYNLLNLILETILSVIRAKRALFALFRPFENRIVIQEAIGFKNNQAIKNLNLNLRQDPFLGKIFKTGEDLFLRPKEYAKNKELQLPYLGQTALGVKIQAGKNIIGAIVLVDKKGENFNYNNQILLNIISRQIASAISEAEKTEEKGLHEELRRVYIKPF